MWNRAIPHRSGSIDLRAIDDSITVDIASLLNSLTLASNAANTQLTSRKGRGGGRGEEDYRVEPSMLPHGLSRQIHALETIHTSLWALFG